MKLLYYDQYLDQMITMPKHIQQKALNFAKKFKADSKSAAIHLEPISSFKDQRLRSARIDLKYRAIIRAPESGDVYYMLWIDNHDEAYRWAENKTADWNEETQTIQIFSAKEISTKAKKIGTSTPNKEGLFSQYKEKDLLKIGIPSVLLPSLQQINNLDGLDALSDFIPPALFENLFFLTDGADIKTLITEIEEGKISSADQDSQAKSINNQRSFIELDEDDAIFQDIIDGEWTKWKFYLHPSQRKIVEYNSKGPIKVSGGAGTGKTVAAIHRLKKLTELDNSGKVIFLTYTNALTENLSKTLADFSLNSTKYDLSAIDSFLYKFALKHGLINKSKKIADRPGVKKVKELWEELFEANVYSYDLDQVMKEYENVILYHGIEEMSNYLRISRVGMGKSLSRRQRSEIWDIITAFEKLLDQQNYIHSFALYNLVSVHLKNNPNNEYRHCIVDELQDLSNVHLRFIRALIKENENDLFLVGDPLQNIYDRRLNFSKANIHIRGKRSRRLRVNYRTSEEIRRKAISVINDITFDDFDGTIEPKSEYISLFHGTPPSIKMFESKDKELIHISELIEKYTEAKGNSEVKSSVICIACRVKNDLKIVKKILHKNSIAYYDVKDRSGSKSGIHLSTFHSLKGLEYKHIILSGVNERTCPYLPYEFDTWDRSQKETYLHKEKSLMYVVITRARETVDILGVGEQSKLI